MIRPRQGFSLIELLVVIAIIAVLIGLLIPAVQKVREAANRIKCGNNLHQLSLALHEFHDAQGKFPPGQVRGPYPEAQVYWNVKHGWAVFILPYIEQQSLYKAYYWDWAVGAQPNQDVVARPLKNFWCPTAPEQDRYDFFGGLFPTYGGKGACGDYAPTWYVDPALAAGDNRGVLVPNGMTRLTDITDGTSSTILLTEDAGRPRLWQAGRAGPDQAVTGGPWAGFDNGITLKGSQLDGASRAGPCGLNCSNDHEVYSFHAGGANAVFADGSVRFLKADIDIRILAALVTRAGGEVVSATDY
jgi:prepilin-type N-terminal cleavage/methylation domain-containing protein/prepilin-type processing-associated H-X9-DG protein